MHLVGFYYKNIPPSVDICWSIFADKCRQKGQKTNRNWVDRNNTIFCIYSHLFPSTLSGYVNFLLACIIIYLSDLLWQSIQMSESVGWLCYPRRCHRREGRRERDPHFHLAVGADCCCLGSAHSLLYRSGDVATNYDKTDFLCSWKIKLRQER